MMSSHRQTSYSYTRTVTGPDGKTKVVTYSSDGKQHGCGGVEDSITNSHNSHVLRDAYGGNRGNYKIKNRSMKGGVSGTGDVKNPAKAVFKLNERGSGLRAKGDVQDFYKIRDECLQSDTLWEDPEFPAEDCSIFFSRQPPKPFEWKRPHEISENPKLFVEGVSRFDVRQGELGDCWLLAAVANLTLNKRLFYQIVSDDQSFDNEYAGIFHFRFWQYGRWVDVVVDDRLPTYYNRLVFLHSAEKNEFWSALLEKAYAKMHGSYEALKGGTTCEAMEDFTGGVTEMYDIDKAPPNLFKILLKAYERSSLMGCSIEADPNQHEAELTNGLIRGHAYSITRVKYVDIKTSRVAGKIPLVRIRNPWGNEAEWKGAWGDKSQEWSIIPDDEKRELGLTFDDDGEFWMSFKDFSSNFMRIEICNLNPDSLEDDDLMYGKGRKWEMSAFEGAWVKNSTAGGCRNFIDTFAHNPQYSIKLTDPDDDDEDDKCTVIIGVMQKNRRAQRKLGLDCLTIGFAIYHLKDDGTLKPLPADFFKYNASVARSQSFINLREVSSRFKLPPGTYIIVPSTFEPNQPGEFVVRVFSEKSNDMEENDQEVGIGEVSEDMKSEAGTSDSSEHDKAIREFFKKIAGDDLEIDWRELKQVLDFALKKEFDFDGFSKDVARSMVAMMDDDCSGKLGLEEFKNLWADIRLWKTVFKTYDSDDSGYLSTFELRKALNSAGYNLNNHILNVLVLRYGDTDGHINFDDFILCAVKLKTVIETFRERDPNSTKSATFSLEEYVEKVMYS